ncbi:hypothetical protein [Enterovirga aerilata]|uniref:Uncharacterized protein n=1 Tax=Enterovirga aerilata TaxID=2730920 RepID=A0A849I927_9HYPH|nr:hypothetical protein [Enterovirga sp. DB1703]NNM72580.1 hypothetical protein [Enterovirga sp. DB1703]
MRPGASCLVLLALAALLLAPPVAAAPASGLGSAVPGARGPFASAPKPGLGRVSYRARPGWGALAGTRYERNEALLRRRAAFRHGRPFGWGYGAFHGLPLGYGGFLASYGAEPILPEFVPPLPKPEWPAAIGIPPSPVEPPAIYVIGERRASVGLSRPKRAGGKPVAVSRGRPGQIASGPVFIRIPSAR